MFGRQKQKRLRQRERVTVSSAELEFSTIIQKFQDHFEKQREEARRLEEGDKPYIEGNQPYEVVDAAYRELQEFDLQALQASLEETYHNRSFREFIADEVFVDSWWIPKNDLAKGNWKKANTFNSHEAIKKGFFSDKDIPRLSTGADDASRWLNWDHLTKKYGGRTYLETDLTLNDYAETNKKIIYELKKLKTKPNHGKVVHLEHGNTVYIAEVTVNGVPTVVWSFLNKIELKKTAWERIMAFYGY
jgi:hypothetical protein